MTKEVRIELEIQTTLSFMADEDWDEDRCIQYILDNKRDFDIDAILRRGMYAEFTGYREG